MRESARAMVIRPYGNPYWRPPTGPRRCRHRRIRHCSSRRSKSPSGPNDVKLHSIMRPTKRASYIAGILAALGVTLPVAAQLRVEVTSGITDPVPIAVVPFSHSSPADGGLDVAQVVQHDLEGSGRFRALPRGRMPSTPT